MPFLMPADNATMRAISYSINSSATHMSPEAYDALARIANRIGVLVLSAEGTHGAAGPWRDIATLALQMEARALGLDYSLPSADKTLTPD